jgi:anti-anti-sigma factor
MKSQYFLKKRKNIRRWLHFSYLDATLKPEAYVSKQEMNMGVKHIRIDEKHTYSDGNLWIVLPDAITMDTYEYTEREIVSSLKKGLKRVVIDLQDTKVMYSSGFGLLVSLNKLIGSKELMIAIVNVSPKVYDGFVTVGLDKVLPLSVAGDSLDFLN